MAAFAKCAHHLCFARSLGAISARRSSFLHTGNLSCRVPLTTRKVVQAIATCQSQPVPTALHRLFVRHAGHKQRTYKAVQDKRDFSWRQGAAVYTCSQARACNLCSRLHHVQVPTDVKFNYFDAEGNMQDISVEDLTKGKKVQMHAIAPFHCCMHACMNALAVQLR